MNVQYIEGDSETMIMRYTSDDRSGDLMFERSGLGNRGNVKVKDIKFGSYSTDDENYREWNLRFKADEKQQPLVKWEDS